MAPKSPLTRDSGRYSAPALDKGLDVLELLAGRSDSLTFSEIALALGRSKSELYRVVQRLEARGYLARTGDGYDLTNRLFALGLARPRIRTLTEAAAPVMRRLVEMIDQSCHLVVLSGDEIVVIHRLESQNELGFSVRVGHRKKASASTSGVLLTAFAKPLSQQQVPSRLRAEGYAVKDSATVAGVTDIAAPIFEGGEAIATLTVPHVRQSPEKLPFAAVVEAVRRAAADVSSELGTHA